MLSFCAAMCAYFYVVCVCAYRCVQLSSCAWHPLQCARLACARPLCTCAPCVHTAYTRAVYACDVCVRRVRVRRCPGMLLTIATLRSACAQQRCPGCCWPHSHALRYLLSVCVYCVMCIEHACVLCNVYCVQNSHVCCALCTVYRTHMCTA
jgi:hypothetical protein